MTESRLRAALKRRWAVVVATGAALLLVGAGATAAVAATPAPAAASSASATCAPGVGPLLKALHAPSALRTDLRHLAKDSTAHKAADRAAIRSRALAGGYGTEVGRVARIVAGSSAPKAKLATAVPAALRTDLKTLRADAKGSAARKAEAATIWTKALNGSYGTDVKAKAATAKARVDTRCAAKAAHAGS